MVRGIQVKPEPYCPDCGARMILRRPTRPGQDWTPFWGCGRFPDCRGRRQIKEDGTPEEDDDLPLNDDEFASWHESPGW